MEKGILFQRESAQLESDPEIGRLCDMKQNKRLWLNIKYKTELSMRKNWKELYYVIFILHFSMNLLIQIQ